MLQRPFCIALHCMNGFKLCYITCRYLFSSHCICLFFISRSKYIIDDAHQNFLHRPERVNMRLTTKYPASYCCRCNSLGSRFNRIFAFVLSTFASAYGFRAHYKQNMVQSQIQSNGMHCSDLRSCAVCNLNCCIEFRVRSIVYTHATKPIVQV